MKAPKEKDSNLTTLVMLGVVFALFTFAYKVGASQGRDDHTNNLKASAKRDRKLQYQLDQCLDDIKRKKDQLETSTDSVSSEMSQKHSDLQTETQKLRSGIQDLMKMLSDCLESAENARASREMQDNLDVAELARLEKVHNSLYKKAQRVNNTLSLEAKLLIANIGKLANEHNRLLRSLGKDQVKVTNEYLTELMMHWSQVNGARFHERLGDVLPPNKTEISSNYKQPRMVNESIASEVEIFRAKHDNAERIEERVWTKPEWKGHVGNRPATFGLQVDSLLQKSTAPRLMRMLYEYILCASGVNTTDLAFPAHFQNLEGDVENLEDLIMTPHISFCRDCAVQHQTSAFRLLCLGYSSKEQYGSKLFWRTRSKLVPSDRIRNEAATFLAKHNREKLIGVRLPKSSDWATACSRISNKEEAPLMFKSALLSDALEVSGDIGEQCNPPFSLVADALNAWGKQVHAEAIFLSSDLEKIQLKKLEEKLDYPIVRVEPGKYTSPSVAALVDITIASQVGYVMVNRYDVQSAHITEYHMLNNKFSGDHIRVW